MTGWLTARSRNLGPLPNGCPMRDVPDQRRNLAGCTIMASVVALFLFLCLYIGLNSRPPEILVSDVETVPTGKP